MNDKKSRVNAFEFQENLRRTGFYRTDPNATRMLADRLFGWTDFWCYARVTAIVCSAYRAAQRGEYTRERWQKDSLDMIRAIEGCGGRLNVAGAENVLKVKHPVVYVANHMSMIETVALPVILLSFSNVTTVVKDSLMRYPLFGRVLTAVGPIVVTRTDPREDFKTVMTEGQEHLTKGCSVLVFPQSTRHIEFDASSFNTIGVKLASRAGVPVVPLALKTDFLGIGRFVRDFGRISRTKTVQFAFGTPLNIASNGKAEHKQIVEFISRSVLGWGGVVKETEHEHDTRSSGESAV